MKKRTKIVTVAVVAVAVVGGGWWWLKVRSAAATPPGPEVRIESPQKGDVVEMVNAPGQVEPRTKVSISARVMARITDLPFEEGARVTKGDETANPPIPPSVLVKLDATDLEASLKSAQAHRAAQAVQIEVEQARLESQRSQLASTEIQLAKAKRDLDRSKQLAETKYMSQSDLEDVQTRADDLAAQKTASEQSLKASEMNIEVMRHNLDAADAEIARAKDALNYTVITSPIDGVLTRRNAKVGELVVTGTMNSPGTVILEVADLSQMLLEVAVDESDIGGIKLGQRANVRIHTYPDHLFTGTVDSIALTHDMTNTGTKYFKTKILLDRTDVPIYSGLTADVDILTQKHSDVLKLPSQAILGRPVDDLPIAIRENNPCVDVKKTFATVVYCFKDGKAVVTPVTVGASDQTHTIVLSGITPADHVIVGPYKVLDTLKHDESVQDEREAQKKRDAEKAKGKPGAKIDSTAAAVDSTGAHAKAGVESTDKAAGK